MRMFALAPPPRAKVLLVGGHDPDWITASKRLQSRGIEVAWHWPNRSSGHRVFPQCNAVILFTRALAHSLSNDVVARAKNAGVHVVHHDSWPRTEAALDLLQIGTPTTPLTAEPPMTPPKKTEDLDLDNIVEAQKRWQSLDEIARLLVQAFAKQAMTSAGRITLNAPSVRSFLNPMAGNPRLFTATLLLATMGAPNHLTATGISRLYREISGKKVDYSTVQGMTSRVRTLLGEEYGLRIGDISPVLRAYNDSRVSTPPTPPPTTPPTTPPASPPSPEAVIETRPPTPEPMQPAPIKQAPPITVDTQLIGQVRVRARFERMLHDALDAGETITVTKTEGAYTLVYKDGTLVTIRNQ